MSAIQVLLADDHAVVRAGLQAILATEPDLAVVGEASTGDEAQRLCLELQPDVLLLDLSMPGPPASETLAFIRSHSLPTRVVMLTAYHDEAAVRELVSRGVSGYVLKDDAAEAVAGAVRAASQGGTWLSPQLMTGLAAHPGELSDEADLTERDMQLLNLLAQGRDDTYIAAELGLRVQTVRNYLSRLYRKIGVASRLEAAMRFRKGDPTVS